MNRFIHLSDSHYVLYKKHTFMARWMATEDYKGFLTLNLLFWGAYVNPYNLINFRMVDIYVFVVHAKFHEHMI